MWSNKIPKISFRGSGVFNRMNLQAFQPLWQGIAVVRKQRVQRAVEESPGGNGFRVKKKRSSNTKKLAKIMDSITLGGDGLFFPNMSIGSQNGSGYGSKAKSKGKPKMMINLSSAEMMGRGLRFE